VAVEPDGARVLQFAQGAADRLWRGGEVRGDGGAGHAGAAQRGILGLCQQKTRQPHDDGIQRQVFDLVAQRPDALPHHLQGRARHRRVRLQRVRHRVGWQQPRRHQAHRDGVARSGSAIQRRDVVEGVARAEQVENVLVALQAELGDLDVPVLDDPEPPRRVAFQENHFVGRKDQVHGGARQRVDLRGVQHAEIR